jgi:hypothetical protein
MRALHFGLITAAVLVIPSVGYAQDSGLVGGRVGADLGTALPGPAVQLRPYGTPLEAGPRAGYWGNIMPGQVVPQDTVITPRPDGTGSAWINGHHVIVGPNSSRILRTLN